MKLVKLNLLNFRNISNLNINFSDGMNIFIGDNAQGKTNILESIVILALTKSHRIGLNPNIIMFHKKKSHILGNVRNNDLLVKLEVTFTENEKTLKLNQNIIRKVAEYISNLNVIVFTPDDLDIIKGSPNIRRNLLNIQLSQMSNLYLNTYNEYNKLLKTRNEYLKILFHNSIADKSYLDIITDKLVEKAIIIYQERKKYIDFINENIGNYFMNIAGFEDLFIKYVPNIDFSTYDTENLHKALMKTYHKNYYKELNNGMTLYGPHRDDFVFYLNDNDLRYFGSEGQQKLAIMAFKLAEIPIFISYCGTNPVLLLDDIFSELDIKKRNKLFDFIQKNNIQSFITTTDLKNIHKKYLKDAFIYEVKNGNVERKDNNGK